MESSHSNNTRKGLQQAYRTAYLVAGHIRQTLSQAEQEELDDWILASPENMKLFGDLTDEQHIASSLVTFDSMKVEEDLKVTKQRLKFKGASFNWSYAIAASVIIAVGVYLYVTEFRGAVKDPIVIQTTDINPGTAKATLTLDNGQVIALDQLADDTSLNGQVNILKQSGEVIYAANPGAPDLVYHTLSIPRAGQYKLTLPDGTKVWLNSASSIKFPVAFSPTERKVFVTGETFFEVAKDPSKPFRVEAADMTAEALGTGFNVNVYPNEPYGAVTLTEGSVRVTKGEISKVLTPGQQLQSSANKVEITDEDTDAISGWKNGAFVFVNTPLEVIMRQVERWYDAEVIYKDEVDVQFNASIQKNVKLSKFLHLLEQTGHVHFEIDGKKIIVSK